ncbi:4b7995bc-2fa0-4682-b859-e16c71af6c6c-CDS [Sclerotinia trifoliorum]|uniref:Required for respiratory growth protein 9, mitochondrial n=1 Tax=Sclerotinia trifoliorum TaxID=28548 RepID=A0A8H2VTF0_9HELO|nr:4b7995bc-2fa0-4682-b859-e16c71af6c6c-CDS [Sclerotinia trifoliorum]
MSCSCTQRTLRLFIRNVAQVELAASSKSTYRPQRTNFRRFNLPSLPPLHPSHSRAYWSAHSSEPIRDAVEDAPIESQEEIPPATEGHINTTSDRIDDMDDLFMEITPESLDALAAETRSELANSQSRESKELKQPWQAEKSRRSIDPKETTEETWIQKEPIDIFSKPMKKPRWDIPVDRMRFRSIKIDNAVSYSPQASTSKRNMVRGDWTPPDRQTWMEQKAALKEKFPEGWKPMKKLSPEAQAGIRALHAQYPEQYSTPALADRFQVSPEAIRRILRTKWVPSPKEEEDRERRWFQRGKNVWGRYAELGVKPPKRWREEGIGRGKPEWKKRAAPVLTTSRPGTSEPRRTETISLDDEMEDRIF